MNPKRANFEPKFFDTAGIQTRDPAADCLTSYSLDYRWRVSSHFLNDLRFVYRCSSTFQCTVSWLISLPVTTSYWLNPHAGRCWPLNLSAVEELTCTSRTMERIVCHTSPTESLLIISTLHRFWAVMEML